MGSVLDLPTDPRHNKDRTWERGRVGNRNTDLQGRTPVILPYNSFDIRPDRVEETDMRIPGPPSQITTPRTPQSFSSLNYSPQSQAPDSAGVEVETTKMNSTFSSIDEAGSQRPKINYIKRYRNEEEKLMDMLHEREITLKSAVRQGQQLRARCNRYKEELESMRQISRVEMTENQWKKKYFEMDKRYRDVKEEMEVMEARNKNGRDFLEQQKETIDVLNLELQREKLHKQQLMSQSLSSLHSVGVTDKKGKMAITQLKIDNKILEERVNDLLLRNQRGRDYLAKVEAENRDHTALIGRLKAQLLQEKAEKDTLFAKFSSITGTAAVNADRELSSPEGPDTTQLYAQVQKKNTLPSDENHNSKADGFHKEESIGASSGGFDNYQEAHIELEHEERNGEVEPPYRVASSSYETIDFSIGMAKVARDVNYEEEVVIEAVIEPEIDDTAANTAKDESTNLKLDTSDKDETDGGAEPSYEPYEPKSVFADDVITRF